MKVCPRVPMFVRARARARARARGRVSVRVSVRGCFCVRVLI